MLTRRGRPRLAGYRSRRAARGRRQQRRAGVARDPQPVQEVRADLVLVESDQAVLESDALAELPHRFGGELAVELGLAEEHDLQELALLGLEVGEQAQRLE